MGRTINRVGTAQWPAIPDTGRVEYRLAGRLVSREMHVDAAAAKRAGVRVMLTTPGGSELDATHDTEVCGNCGGFGRLYLQSLVAGPFKEPPAHGPEEHIGFHGDRWYKMTLRAYSCPVCQREIIL